MKKSVAIKFMLQFVCLAAGSAHAAQEMVDCDGCPVMVVIPAGEFMMGSSAEESGHPDEKPVRKIIIKKDFAVSKFEITFDEWARCVGAGGCSDVSDEGWGRGKRPVININFAAAQSYVNWLSKSTQKSYRLLSEAEWEYAARAGTTTAWPWGSHKGRGGVKEACAFSNSHDASSTAARPDFAWLPNPCSDGYAYTAPVGTFKPNAFGLYDMLGNVKEWVKDCKGEYKNAPTDGSSYISEACVERIVRGGGWVDGPSHSRSAYRHPISPTESNYSVGLRVARDL